MHKNKNTINLSEIYHYFHDEVEAHKFLVHLRWREKPKCLYCNHNGLYVLKNKIRYKCKKCERQFTAKTGLFFSHSRQPLYRWFYAIMCITSNAKGKSSEQLAKDLNIPFSTAWYMLKDIRKAQKNDMPKPEFNWFAQVDEAYFGGKKHWRNEYTEQTPVFGAANEKGEIFVQVVPDCLDSTLLPILESLVPPTIDKKGFIGTDGARMYWGLSKKGYTHGRVCHNIKQWISNGDPKSGTNLVEAFWSKAKKMIRGTHHWVSRKYLPLYLASLAFRYNTHKMTDYERFEYFFANLSTRKVKFKKTEEVQEKWLKNTFNETNRRKNKAIFKKISILYTYS